VLVAVLLAPVPASGQLSAEESPAITPSVQTEADLETELIQQINAERRLQGVEPLRADGTLTEVARGHSREMAVQGRLGHTLREGGSLRDRLQDAGYLSRSARENVACAPSIRQAHSALLNSPPHVRNLTAPEVTRVGVGIVRLSAEGRSELYVTQIFAQPARSRTDRGSE
jgi:uncharacterized protein YkwD